MTNDPLVEYVVQRLRPDVASAVWDDIATVRVPKRTWTRTALLAALEQAGIDPLEALKREDGFRVLDEEAARVHKLKVKEPSASEVRLG